MVQQMIAILLGLYLVCEAISAASQMDGGDKLSRVGKYLLVSIIGIWLIVESCHVDPWHLTMAFALCLFVWPKMVARLEQLFEQLIGD